MSRVRPMERVDFQQVCSVYKASFAGSPWYEELSDAEVYLRLAGQFKRPGFSALVLEENNQIVGAHWHDIVSMDLLLREQGPDIVRWIHEQGLSPLLLVWGRELIVHPDYQRRGFAHQLRSAYLDKLKRYNANLLVLSRLREDNIGTIRSAERMGMTNTGISKPASQKPLRHYYWTLQLSGK